MITPNRNPRNAGLNVCLIAPAVGLLRGGSFFLAALLSLLSMESAQAVDIPLLSVMQPAIAAIHPELVTQRETLTKERKALLDRTNAHNTSCDTVEVGSVADASCTKAYATLEMAINNHVQASQRYNEHYLAAVTRAAQTKPASPVPFSDSSVVDARNVPSGLPESVEKAIPHTPSGDNVRKGFQAIDEHDWKVALAWFKDALNHEPGSPGLQRLVDLAQYTLQRHSELGAKPIDDATAVGKRSPDKMLKTGMNHELNKALNDYYENNPPKWLKPGRDIQSDTEWLNEKEPAWKNFFRLFTPAFNIKEDGTLESTGIRG